MDPFLKIEKALEAGTIRLPFFPLAVKLPFTVLAFVGMSMGLVGSCNMNAIGARDAMAATGPASQLSHWQIRSHGKAVTDNPEHVLNLTGVEIATLFNAPALERRDLPSVVWQYMNDECVMDIYFDAGEDGDVMKRRAMHIDVRSRTAGKEPGTSCVSELVSNGSGVESAGISLAQAEHGDEYTP